MEEKTDNIGEDVPIQIHSLGNGFLIRPSYSPSDSYGGHSYDQEYVFESFQGLMGWLSEHFTHRNNNVRSD